MERLRSVLGFVVATAMILALAGCNGGFGGAGLGYGFPFGWGFPLGVFFFVKADPDTVTPVQQQWMKNTEKALTAKGFQLKHFHSQDTMGYTASRYYPRISQEELDSLASLARRDQGELLADIKTQRSRRQIQVMVDLAETEESLAERPVECRVTLSLPDQKVK